MPYRIFAIVVFALLTASQLQAQDVIKFKNGSFVRGTGVEYIQGSHVRIKTEEGVYKTFPADQIRSTRNSRTPHIKEAITVPTRSFYNHTTLGMMFGRGYYFSVNPSFQMVNGYQFGGRYQVGAGMGMELFEDDLYLPTFLETKVFLNKDRCFSPFIGLQAGYATLLSNRNPMYYDLILIPGEEEPRNRGGLLGGVQIGLRNYTKQDFGYVFSIGYRMQQSRSWYYNYLWEVDSYYGVQENLVRNRVEVRFGIYFH